MNGEHIEQIKTVHKIDTNHDCKLRNDKKIKRFAGKPCIYFKDIPCRIPFCDMETCSKCPEGYVYCLDNNPNPLKKMLHKIMGIVLFLIALFGEETFLYEFIENMLISL